MTSCLRVSSSKIKSGSSTDAAQSSVSCVKYHFAWEVCWLSVESVGSVFGVTFAVVPQPAIAIRIARHRVKTMIL